MYNITTSDNTIHCIVPHTASRVEEDFFPTLCFLESRPRESRISEEGKAKQCIGVMMSFCSILLRFLNRTSDTESGVQCGVTAHLAI